MTWFEAQQVYDYVTDVETALDEWALTRYKMLSEKVALSRLRLKIRRDLARDSRSSKGILMREICYRIQECQDCITERLKS